MLRSLPTAARSVPRSSAAWPVGFSTGSARFVDITIDSNDVPYVAMSDSGVSDKISVRKYNGSTWVIVGSDGFSDGAVDHVHLTFDNNNVPYVSYLDKGNSNKSTVKKFDGSNWVTVGSQGFSAGEAMRQRMSVETFRNVMLFVFLVLGLNLIRRAIWYT